MFHAVAATLHMYVRSDELADMTPESVTVVGAVCSPSEWTMFMGALLVREGLRFNIPPLFPFVFFWLLSFSLFFLHLRQYLWGSCRFSLIHLSRLRLFPFYPQFQTLASTAS